MSSVFVSYIVPCYNVQDYLPRCIESLKKQKIEGKNIEFIIINDGSVDGTLSLICNFEKDDERVVVIDQPNQGVCAARNNGLKLAKGEYVFFLDGDDWLPDDASEKMYRFCKDAYPDVALFGNYKIKEGQEKVEVWVDCSKHISPGVYTKEDYINKTTYFPISCKLYRLSFLRENEILFDRELITGEVYTFYIHSVAKAKTIGVSSDFIMYYLKRKGNSATTSLDIKRDLSILDTLHTINRYVSSECLQMGNKKAYLASVFWLVTSFAIIKYVGRSPYNKEIGQLMSLVKKDGDYQSLLNFFSGKGLSLTKHSLLALCIRSLPNQLAYNIIRKYYMFATKDRLE